MTSWYRQYEGGRDGPPCSWNIQKSIQSKTNDWETTGCSVCLLWPHVAPGYQDCKYFTLNNVITAGEISKAQLTLNWLPPMTQKPQTRSSCYPSASLKRTWEKGSHFHGGSDNLVGLCDEVVSLNETNLHLMFFPPKIVFTKDEYLSAGNVTILPKIPNANMILTIREDVWQFFDVSMESKTWGN